MPTLPSITVTDAQFARLKAILPGATDAEKAAAYRQGTIDFWRRQVIDADIRKAEADAAAAVEAARASAAANADNL